MLIVAIPTIGARGEAWKAMGAIWTRTCPRPLLIVPSWRRGSWAAGLNEVWEHHPDAEVFICASDDMYPEEGWYPEARAHLDRGECPVPTVISDDGKGRRMVTHGGTEDVYWRGEPTEGAPARMTNFPILKREWLDICFPLPNDLHYCSDDLIGDRLKDAGIPLVTCLDITITHSWDERGRGAGMGDESTRLVHDREVYRRIRADA